MKDGWGGASSDYDAADDLIDDKSESISKDDVASMGVNGEGKVPPASPDTFLGFVSDLNHKADFTDDGAAESFAACSVVTALPGVPEAAKKPKATVSGMLVLVVAVVGEVRRFWVITLVVGGGRHRRLPH